MPVMWGRRTRHVAGDDRGAVAVIVAILALLLFGVSALAVDLGNMWSRKRMAQTSADLAALAGAAWLPDQTAALDKAYEYLTSSGNFVGENALPAKGVLDDNVLANGEIDVTADTVTVDLPPRSVSFGLATAIGFAGSSVSAHAVAAVRSPASTLPVFTPLPCSNGSFQIKVASQTQYNFVPAGDSQGPNVATLVPGGTSAGTPQTVLVGGTGFDADPPAGVSAMFTLNNANITAAAALVGPVTKQGQSYEATYSVVVPATVYTTVGVWKVRLSQTIGGNPHWSQDSKSQEFSVTPVAGACGQNATGDFGLLQSPRKSGNPADWPRWNFADGLDHGVDTFPSPLMPPLNTECLIGAVTIPGAILDNTPNRDDANCMDILTGNKVDVLGDGLVTGDGTFPGRLTRTHSKSGCTGPGGAATRTTVNGVEINTTTIGCYLNGRTIAQLVANPPEAGFLDPEIFNDPRFFYLPVFNTDRPPANGWYPIVEFQAAFITDELVNQAATSENGLTFQNGKLIGMRALVFDRSALPSSVPGSGNGSVYTGGTKIVRLIE